MKAANGEMGLIPLGKTIRKLRIDKLPQLINVFLGELSLIGPSPVIPNETREDIPWYRERFYATPGMIGLCDTREKNQLSYDDIIRQDIRYARERSFWFDINILKNRLVAMVLRVKIVLFSRRVYVSTKPFLDSFLAIFGLTLFLPLFFLVGVLIKITSKGPVFYSQERVGAHGQIFEIVKFRTMHCKAEDEFGPTWAKKNDPRTTFIGSILRKTHIDELPQFVNVIQGEMSMVGPRPERPYFVNKFVKDIPGYAKRLAVKPGMTGLAQCYYKYDETLRDVEKKIHYDIFYIKKMCWLLDFKIMLLTLRVSLFGETQYRDQGS